MSSEDSDSSPTDKSFQYMNSCGTKWRISTDMAVCLAIEADRTVDLEHAEVGADDV